MTWHAIAGLVDPAELLRAAPDGMLLVDEIGIVRYANRQAEVIFGGSGLVGHGVEQLVPEQLRERHRVHREGFAATPAPRPMGTGLDLTATRADGTEFAVEISLSPLPVGQHRLTLAAVRDVTGQRLVQQALRTSEERFRLTFEHSPVGIALMALDGTLTAVNPAMCAVTGSAEQALLSASLADLLADDPVLLDLTTVDPRQLVRQLHRTDGSTRWLEVTLVVVRDGAGAPLHVVGHFYDVTDRRAHEQDLQARALTDPLTGLPNRTLLFDRTEQALAELSRHPARCALFVLDIDRFKVVNDTLGHLAGDELLRQVAARLQQTARSNDTVARLGGDEFAVLCRDLPQGERDFSERLLAAFDEPFALQRGDGSTVPTRAATSIGVAVCSMPGVTAIDLYRDADLALYRAKADGRARSAHFDDVRWSSGNIPRQVTADQDRRLPVPPQRPLPHG